MIEQNAVKQNEKEQKLYTYSCRKALQSEIVYDLVYFGCFKEVPVVDENMMEYFDGAENAKRIFEKCTIEPNKAKTEQKNNERML